MSLSDLRKMNLLKSEQDWTGRMPRSAVSGFAAFMWLVAAIAGCVSMAVGVGRGWTWVGLGLFSLALWRFVALSLRSIDGVGLGSDQQRPSPSSED